MVWIALVTSFVALIFSIAAAGLTSTSEARIGKDGMKCWDEMTVWEKGYGTDEPPIGSYVEVMTGWAERRAADLGLSMIYGQVIDITERPSGLPISNATYVVRVVGMHDIRFRSTAHLRQMSLIEQLALS